MESAGNGIYMADAINTTSSSSSSSGIVSGGKGTSSFSPAVIAIVGILGTAFLLVSYYTMVAKFCRGRGQRMGWAGRRRNGLNEEEQGLQAAWPAAAQMQEQGLEQAEIEAIPVVEFLRRARSKSSSGALDCAVCLSEFEEAERVRLLPSCCHAFHLACIDVWLRSHASCPVCRTPINSHMDALPPLSSPTSPLFAAAAGSAHASPPFSTTPPYRLVPIPGDENPHVLRSPSSATAKLEALAIDEREAQVLRKGLRSPRKQLGQLDAVLLRGATDHFSFGRCFSTGRSRGVGLLRSPTSHLHFDDGQSLQDSILLSSTSPKYTHMMQRSSSYSVGSIFPILKRPSPIHREDQMQMLRKSPSSSKAGVTSSFSPSSFSSSSAAAAVAPSSSSSHDDKSVICEGGQILQFNSELRSQSHNHHFYQELMKRGASGDGCHINMNDQYARFPGPAQISDGGSSSSLNARPSIATYHTTTASTTNNGTRVLMKIPNPFKRSLSGGRL